MTGLLGLTLDGNRFDGVALRRVNGALRVQQTFSATLTLDPLTAAPELAGREIRNHLAAAGVTERRCVVGVPLQWMFVAHTELPPLPEPDAASLLQLEAERAFPCDTATLRLASSRCPLAEGKRVRDPGRHPRCPVDRAGAGAGRAKLNRSAFPRPGGLATGRRKVRSPAFRQ